MISLEIPFAATTLVDVLRRRAEYQPTHLAFAFLRNGVEVDGCLTYALLDRQARSLAAMLQARLRPGERVLLSFPEGTEFVVGFFGCLYAGMIAVPVPFPDAARARRTRSRIEAIAGDAQPALNLSAAPAKLLGTSFPDWTWEYTADIDQAQSDDWQPPNLSGETLAYLQYTSGSTGIPKGVMIRHQNVMHNLQELNAAAPYSPGGSVVSWMPHFHDYGLVEGILRPIYGGVPGYLMAPWTFLKRPITWFQAINRYRITHAGAAAFAYDYCVQKIAQQDLAGLDLSCWQTAVLGAEPVHPETLRTFSAAFSSVGFRPEAFAPSYGLAEVTLLATAKSSYGVSGTGSVRLQEHHDRLVVGCGHAYGSSRFMIVHPEQHTRCAEGETGEIWIKGPSVAAGYWKREQETQETFRAFLADSGEGPFLRSGDIGFITQGDLFITGRLKNMIISHGENYYAEDIEWIVRNSHPLLQTSMAAAFSLNIGQQERLVIVQEVERGTTHNIDLSELIQAVRQAVADHFSLAVYGVAIVKRRTIPRTSSGKIQRLLCREAYLDQTLTVLAQWSLDDTTGVEAGPIQDELEARLVQMWQTLLEHPQVQTRDDFFSLGGDSLLALQLSLAIEEQLHQTLPNEFFQQPTIEYLAYLLRGGRPRTVSLLDKPVADRVGQPESVPIQSGTRRPIMIRLLSRLRSKANNLTFHVPYRVGRGWLYWWFGWRLVQRLLYHKQILTIRRYYLALGLPQPVNRRVIQKILADSLISARASSVVNGASTAKEFARAFETARRSFWKPFGLSAMDASNEQFKLHFSFSRRELVDQYQGKRGVILVMYHNTYGSLAIPALTTLGLKAVRTLRWAAIRNESRQLYPGIGDEDLRCTMPFQRAAHIHRIRTCLLEGGLVVIATDGQEGQGQTLQHTIVKRMFPLKTDFAELALHADAAVVPTNVFMTSDGRLHIIFRDPLDAGDVSMSTSERIEHLVRQFAVFFDESLRQAPDSIAVRRMELLLKLPLQTSEPSHA